MPGMTKVHGVTKIINVMIPLAFIKLSNNGFDVIQGKI